MVSNGYLWGDDGQALRSFDGWFTVGDQGYLDAGELHILGRRADMIITAGKNVYPHEVELALASVPGVAAAIAAGMPDDLRGQRVVAGIVPSAGGVTATQLKAGLEEHPGPDKRPLQYYRPHELPVTDRGKVSRRTSCWTGSAREIPGSAALAPELLPPDRQPVIIAARRTPGLPDQWCVAETPRP
jgi:long-chain acyl-CoA synthetase